MVEDPEIPEALGAPWRANLSDGSR